MCSTQVAVNTGCGQIQYEPFSVEGPDRYPDGNSAPDGKLASASATSRFPELDEQTATRWVKNPVSAGPITFEWTYQAPHATRDWRYFITKGNWNPNAPLARASFEDTPFCSYDGNMQAANTIPNHACTMPSSVLYWLRLLLRSISYPSSSQREPRGTLVRLAYS